MDGNVFRVLARIYGITSDISTQRTKKEFQQVAAGLIPKENPAIFNQAIMDFGATQCTPKGTDCTPCPFQTTCVAYQTNQIDKLPVKLSKTKVKNRYMDFLIYLDKEGNTQLEQRIKKDIWQNLYQFPVVDRFDETPINIREHIEAQQNKPPITQVECLTEEVIIHQLSHQKLHIHFWLIKTNHTLEHAIPWTELNKFGFPIVIHNFIQSLTV